MTVFWWYLTRSSGVVATVLIAVSLFAGLLFSGRATGNRPKPNWWLDFHNMVGGLAFGFTVLHVVAVVVDPDAGFTLVQAIVPGKASDLPLAMGYGIVATYLLALVVFTSWPRLRFRRRVWRAVHLTSVPAAVLTALHAYQAGTDHPKHWFQLLLAVLGGLLVYPTVMRLDAVRRKRLDRADAAVGRGRFSPNS